VDLDIPFKIVSKSDEWLNLNIFAGLLESSSQRRLADEEWLTNRYNTLWIPLDIPHFLEYKAR
jgi:hypothetical protein